jgi:hypothetical protein
VLEAPNSFASLEATAAVPTGRFDGALRSVVPINVPSGFLIVITPPRSLAEVTPSAYVVSLVPSSNICGEDFQMSFSKVHTTSY